MYRQTTAPAYRRWSLTIMLAGVLIALVGGTATAQQPTYVTSDVPTFSGALLKLRVETPTQFTFSTGGTTPTFTYLNQPAGRFQLQTSAQIPQGGNPTRSGDESAYIAGAVNPYATATWGYEYTNKVTVAIDPGGVTGTTQVGVFQDPHYIARLRGTATTQGGLLDLWPTPPTAGTRDVTGVFRVPVDTVTTTSQHTEWITVSQSQKVIGDTVEIEYVVTNDSTATHSIGLRIMLDAAFGSFPDLDGSPIILPSGRQISEETTLPDPRVANDTVPDSWVAYDNAQNPNVVLRGILNSSEVNNAGTATQAGGKPDAISFGQFRNIGAPDAMYYFNPNRGASLIGEDWGYAVWWAARDLQPGESRRYVTYYGLGSSAADYETPYALMAYAPVSLKAHTGDDPATPDTVEQYYVTDDVGRSPFPVSVYMDNFGNAPIYDSPVRIRLPEGLELVAGESVTKSAGIINRNEIKSVTWNVFATNSRPGIVDIRFTGPRGKVVTRQLNIPAVPVLNPLPNSANGLEMVSIPYEFSNDDAEVVFGTLGSLLPGGPASLIHYDPTTNEYRWFPDPEATSVTPGRAYWLLNRNRTPVVLPAGATPVDTTRVYNLDLKAGWNQIGNPFTSSVRMDGVRVAAATGGEWSLADAVDRNMLLPTIFAYDPATNSYTWDLSPSDSWMNPYTGYWILAREDCTLLIPPPSMFGTAQARPSQTAVKPIATGLSNWKLDLRVNTSGLPAETRTLAVRSNATKGLDRYDVPEPPASVKQQEGYLHSAFYPGQSAVGTSYLVDAHGPAEDAQEWNLIVKTNMLNADVAVTWPSLQSLPPTLIATLVDEATGERRYMRTTNSYVIHTGGAPTERLLKVIVQPRPAQSLAVTSVQSAQTGQGATTLSYTLSADAAVDIRIRNLSGVVVSEVATGQLSTAGRNTALWNGRNTRGSYVPSGRYLCQITAKSPLTGQSMSVVHPLEIKR